MSFPHAVSRRYRGVPTVHQSPVTVLAGSPIEPFGDDDLLVTRG
ncbi:MAG TPA: hypothetical protein PK599_05910 [bacterium]|nr:hypothetical protein [bacterium]